MGAVVFFGVFFTGLAVAAAVFFKSSMRQAPDGPLRQAARELGLDCRSSSTPGAFSPATFLAGALGDFEVVAEVQLPKAAERHGDVRITIRADDAIPQSLRIAGREWLPKVTDMLSPSDLKLGAPDFDSSVVLSGSATETVALLDYRTRKAVERAVVVNKAEVFDGAVNFSGRVDLARARPLVDLVHQMHDLAQRLDTRGPRLEERLASSSCKDPHRKVRVRNLRELLATYPEAPETLEASRTALTDRRAAMRMLGASVLGTEGNEVAQAVLDSENVELDVQLAALDHLVAHLQGNELADLFERALATSDNDFRCRVVEQIARVGHRQAIPRLRELLVELSPQPGDPPVATNDLRQLLGVFGAELIITIVVALAKLGAAEAEPELVALLPLSDTEIQRAAILTLGRVGSVHAVEPLSHVQQRSVIHQLKKMAREAIDRIQARLGDAAPGHLSVLPDEDGRGALSIAGAPGALSPIEPVGAVSMVEEDTPVSVSTPGTDDPEPET